MDETTYSDAAVIEAIKARYVPVRVDNDERPDVNARYNMGGWPTTAFLSDDGTTLTGATYLPPQQMLRVLTEISDWYAEHRDDVAAHAASARVSQPVSTGGGASLLADIADRIVAAIAQTFDNEYGGFGEAPKFPQPELLETLLVEAQATKNDVLRAMVVRTLLAMAQGGMYDHVEGGFFRYSTTRDWSIPHFEKMTEEHAGLLRVLSMLLERSSHEALRATLRSCLGYVMQVLRDSKTGLFAGSQDADEEYYTLPLEERRRRRAPFVDRTVYADRNAALAGALCLCGVLLDDDALVAAGTCTLDALHDRMLDADGLLFHVCREDTMPSVRGLVGDQSAYLRALLDAHEVTGEPRFLERAHTIGERILERFEAPDGGFYDHAGIEETLGRLSLSDRPIGENAILAESLMRLGELRAEQRYRAIAGRTLLVYASSFSTAGPFAAPYARALRRYLSPAVTARIVGSTSVTGEFRETARRLPSPFVNVRTVAPRDAAALDVPPAPEPAAYVCAGNACGPPAVTAAALRESYDAVAG